MFSKAKRFEPVAAVKVASKGTIKNENEKSTSKVPVVSKSKPQSETQTSSKPNLDTQSQCSSSVKSAKSFVTPRPIKHVTSRVTSSIKKPLQSSTKVASKVTATKVQDDLMKAHEVEIRNKDHTIKEYLKQIEDLKNEIAKLHKMLDTMPKSNDLDKLDCRLASIKLNDEKDTESTSKIDSISDAIIKELRCKVHELEGQCDKLEEEVSGKQVELSSLEDVITIRDSLCKDLQKKLTDVESSLDETRQRLEMVKGHHALALEANESIRREYKVELETLKSKMDDEKQSIINKSKADQDSLKLKFNNLIETVKHQVNKEKDDKIYELQQLLTIKDQEMKAKLEQIDEATCEKLKLCEIQFDERSRTIHEHWTQQQSKLQCLENEVKNLKHTLGLDEEKQNNLLKEITSLKAECVTLEAEKSKLNQELEKSKEEFKKRTIDFENEVNRLTAEIDKVTKEKNKFEMSLSVTRDIVQVLTLRLRESDNELEHLEIQVQTLTDSKELLESELATYKNSFNNTLLECNEYKEALVNILKSKAALAKEHNRIMEHNVTLIESLQNVEKEAYRELGSIKNELIEDVELIKKESTSQIKILREEVERKRALCALATEQAAAAAAAAEQARALLAPAAAELARLEADNRTLHTQIQDQQSLVVELSLLRQENEELTMTLAKQSSVIDKMKKDVEQVQAKPKSPSVFRKTQKAGKENLPNIVSPLRERNH